MRGDSSLGSVILRTAFLLVLAGVAAPEKATAEDFTFKRIKVPAPGSGPRITVQIDPEEQARIMAARRGPAAPEAPLVSAGAVAASPARPGAGGTYAWFWEVVPSGRGVAGAFDTALAALGRGPAGTQVNAPRLQHLQEVAAAHGTSILKATIGTRVSPALALAVIAVESSGRTDALSHKGAQGLMQLIPATAERFGVTDATNAEQNIRGGVAYLDWLMKRFDHEPLMVLAAYNAGEGAVDANGGIPPYAETRDYVPKVLAAWQVAQGLCLTRPALMTDPCVFKVVAVSN